MRIRVRRWIWIKRIVRNLEEADDDVEITGGS
jgi:hypothetical protein